MPEYFSRGYEPLEVGDLCITQDGDEWFEVKVEVVEGGGRYKVSKVRMMEENCAHYLVSYGDYRLLK
jgi:hypothetical protein